MTEINETPEFLVRRGKAIFDNANIEAKNRDERIVHIFILEGGKRIKITFMREVSVPVVLVGGRTVQKTLVQHREAFFHVDDLFILNAGVMDDLVADLLECQNKRKADE